MVEFLRITIYTRSYPSVSNSAAAVWRHRKLDPRETQTNKPIILQSLSEYFVCVWIISVLFSCFIGSKTPGNRCEGEKMVSTKHCCWGKCTNDSRYPEKLPKSLQEMLASGQKVFMSFPKPSQGIEKCQRWITTCSRKYFDVSTITRNTFIYASLAWRERIRWKVLNFTQLEIIHRLRRARGRRPRGGGGGVLPYISYIGMCRPKEYGFELFFSENGYRFWPLWS